MPSAIKIHDGVSGHLGCKIIVDRGVLAVQSDTPLAVGQLIPNQAGIVYELLDHHRELLQNIWPVVAFCAPNARDGEFGALHPPELDSTFSSDFLDLLDFIERQSVWRMYEL